MDRSDGRARERRWICSGNRRRDEAEDALRAPCWHLALSWRAASRSSMAAASIARGGECCAARPAVLCMRARSETAPPRSDTKATRRTHATTQHEPYLAAAATDAHYATATAAADATPPSRRC